ncbi:hypothetical protein BT93_L0938 [Corymbia citriodora subsp. variegata]|uniref:Uncharacterized protein n=1 Tax=Corymbia citriodora subsp. variegata TaxID=360336 RepID=A0A8T0D0E5_CORYI|nr:hypothetical protein BT93_L0938 [Corymbia citriodora subsp. variegata]
MGTKVEKPMPKRSSSACLLMARVLWNWGIQLLYIAEQKQSLQSGQGEPDFSIQASQGARFLIYPDSLS